MRIRNCLSFIFITLLILGCEETKQTEDDFSIKVALEGAVQKGPFLNGTAVQITELEADLSPTGRTFSSQIENNAGLFTLPTVTYSSQYVELQAEGYYYNEIEDSPSASPLTLYAISDITNRTTVNVNLISTLERPRVKYLLAQGYDYESAKDSAFQEVLDIFSFSGSGSSSSEDLNIISTGEDNAILLAISLILQSTRSEAELGELVSNISFDLREDGTLTSASSMDALLQGAVHINGTEVREHLENRYSDLGLNSQIGDFSSLVAAFRSSVPELSATVVKEIDCSGGKHSSVEIIVSGGQPPYQYTWDFGAAPSRVDTLGPGTYSVTVLDSYDKELTIQNILVPDILQLTLNLSHISQENPTGSIDLEIAGGEEPYEFSWSDGSTGESLSTSSTGFYSIIVTDVNGCSIDTTLELINLDHIEDYDGNVYRAVAIGGQIWLSENLHVKHYNNGDPIDHITGNVDWVATNQGAYCIVENNPTNEDIYGLMYNWYAATDSRGIAPIGWRIPSEEDWNQLITFLGGESVAGGKLKEEGTEHWYSPNVGATNESRFTALPGTDRNDSGDFGFAGADGVFWTSTASVDQTKAIEKSVYHSSEGVFSYSFLKIYGFSVRCIKD